MHSIMTIIAALLAIFIVVLIHEMGHFFMARLYGVKILKFSIGFGKALWSHQAKSGTEYAIGILPLGGYVRMLGEMNDPEASDNLNNDPAAYHSQPLRARMAIVLAGPMINFLLAVLLFFCIYLPGITYVKPVIGKILPGSIAAKAGLKTGDTIAKIGHIKTYNWQRVTMALMLHVGDKKSLVMRVVPASEKKAHIKTLALRTWKFDPDRPDFFNSLGFYPYVPTVPAVIAKILPDSPAAKSRLQAGDKIVSLDSKPIADWVAFLQEIEKNPKKIVTLEVLRHGVYYRIPVSIGERKQQGKIIGYLGIYSLSPSWPKEMIYQQNYTFFSAWLPAIEQTSVIIVFNAVALYKMLIGKLSLHALGGPISIFQVAGKASQAGWTVYFGFIAFISAALAFINILPIPGLDGGHFLFQIIEGIQRRPVSARMQIFCIKLGFLLLILIMVIATLNDIGRLMTY